MEKQHGMKCKAKFLALLTIKPVLKEPSNDETKELLTIELKNYLLLSPDTIPLDDREVVQKAIKTNHLYLIKHWKIDPDYDGRTFHISWQNDRENTDDRRIMLPVTLIVPKRTDGIRKVCVKVVDMFGFESTTTGWLRND